MIQKIILAILLCFIVGSCGKKGDPKFINPEKKAKFQTILVKKA